MKTIFMLTAFFLALACTKHDGKTNLSKEFERHQRYLDSVINNNTFDTTCISSVKFMERVTNIKAHPDMTTVGPIIFTRADLEAWKSWYVRNKASLK